MLAIFSIGSALTYMFGRMIGNQRQGWALWFAMTIVFVAGFVALAWAEQSGNPLLFNPVVLAEIVLPTGKFYRFTYTRLW